MHFSLLGKNFNRVRELDRLPSVASMPGQI